MKERTLIVSRLYQGQKKVSSIRLSGLWLERLGFAVGGRFRVQEEPGRVVLIAEAGGACAPGRREA